MTSRDFCYWLQGFFEITEARQNGTVELPACQVEMIRKHLALVFKHEIDPSFGDELQQGILNQIHNGNSGVTFKC